MPDQHTETNLEDLTIRELFELPLDSAPELAAGLDVKDFAGIEKKLSAVADPIPWSRVRSELAAQVSAALNTGLLDAWASAWKTYTHVKEDVEQSRKSPDTVVLSRLAEHSIESTLHLYVEVFLGPARLEKIVFDVSLATHLSGLILGIRNGLLVSLQAAQCDWTGSIAVKQVTLLKRRLKTLDLPGRIVLKHAIRLTPN